MAANLGMVYGSVGDVVFFCHVRYAQYFCHFYVVFTFSFFGCMCGENCFWFGIVTQASLSVHYKLLKSRPSQIRARTFVDCRQMLKGTGGADVSTTC